MLVAVAVVLGKDQMKDRTLVVLVVLAVVVLVLDLVKADQIILQV
jgi:hypothetical protein